MISDKKITFVW